jgi:hypothetical protein
MRKERIGSNFDDFLREELLEVSRATAVKRVIPPLVPRSTETDA